MVCTTILFYPVWWVRNPVIPRIRSVCGCYAEGRHDVAGDEIFANVMAITSCPASEKNFEAHHSYIDIHYVIEGEELLGTAPVGECPALQEFNEADDFCLYGDPADPARVTWTLLRAGELCMTPPADAHKPACCVGDPAPLRKACVKVLVG